MSTNSPQRIKAAGFKILKSEGIKIDALVEYMKKNNVTQTEMIEAHKSSKKRFDSFDALKLSTDCKLSTRGYNLLRSSFNYMTGLNPFPRYRELLSEKPDCYPELHTINDLEVRSSLKDVLKLLIDRYI